MQALLFNLLRTLLAEAPVYGFYLRREPLTAAVFIVLINVFTLPLATVAYVEFDVNWYVVEISVVVVEGLLTFFFWQKPLWQCLLVALLANIPSAYAHRWMPI